MLDMLSTLEKSKPTAADVRKNSVERERLSAWLEKRIAAAKKEPSAEVVTVTPTLAELLLERNRDNRQLSKNNADALAADVSNGRFQFNGESIVLSENGDLLDGQHRCAVVIATGQSIQTVIVFGPKNDARFTIDIGRPKTASNFLFMKGQKNTVTLASAVRLTLLFRKNGHFGTGGNTGGAPVTKTEVVDSVAHLRGISESVEFCTHHIPVRLVSRSLAAFAHYQFWKKSAREAADHFIARLGDGENMRRGDPILYCRNRLPSVTSAGSHGLNLTANLLFKAWNAHRLGHSVTTMALTGKLPKLER